MENTPKLPRKSLSLTSRLRSRSSASPGSHLGKSLNSSSPITIEYGLDCTPPNRKCIFNSPYSPTKDLDFSPRSTLSQSSTNSPDVTWRWTQNDPITENSSPQLAPVQSTPNSSNGRELRKKRSIQRKEELHRLEMEKRRAIKTKRDIVLKQKYEEMEQLISKKTNVAGPTKCKEPHPPSKERSLSNSSGYGSNSNIDNVVDLLNDSESDNLLIEASQKVEINIEKNNTQTNLNESLVQNQEKQPVCEFLQDSLDDWFASLDADLLAAQPKKPRTSLQRFNSMPTESPTAAKKSMTPKIKRYTSSSTLPPKSSFVTEIDIFNLLKKKLKENQSKVENGQVDCFQKRSLSFIEH